MLKQCPNGLYSLWLLAVWHIMHRYRTTSNMTSSPPEVQVQIHLGASGQPVLPKASITIAYMLAARMMKKMRYAIPVTTQPDANEIYASSSSEASSPTSSNLCSCFSASAPTCFSFNEPRLRSVDSLTSSMTLTSGRDGVAPDVGAVGEPATVGGLGLSMAATGFRTDITDLDDVNQMSGAATKGSTMANATWDATRSVSIPGRPTAMATTTDGIRPMSLVIIRRRNGCQSGHSRLVTGAIAAAKMRTHRHPPLDEALGDNLASQCRRDTRGLSSTKQCECEYECSHWSAMMGSAQVRFRFT